jgi:hypothetical protein
MKKPQFYTRIPRLYSIVLIIIWAIGSIITLGLLFNTLYDFCLQHKYWRNRRILYKYLSQKDLKYTKETILNDITQYKFNTFDIWVWNKSLKLTLGTPHFYDIIGLFTSSKSEDRMVMKLIRRLNQLPDQKIN